jgi:AraC family transcriptional regulator
MTMSTTPDESFVSLPQIRGTVFQVMTLLKCAVSELDLSSNGAKLLIDRAASILLEEIGQPLSGVRLISEPVISRQNGLLAWQARRVLDYVEEHLSETIRVADLSCLVRLTESHFSRAFRKRFGAAPHSYIVCRRVRRSVRLMLEDELSLSEVALACGFSDQAHFGNTFRRLMGITPAAWRRSNTKSGTPRTTAELAQPAVTYFV